MNVIEMQIQLTRWITSMDYTWITDDTLMGRKIRLSSMMRQDGSRQPLTSFSGRIERFEIVIYQSSRGGRLSSSSSGIKNLEFEGKVVPSLSSEYCGIINWSSLWLLRCVSQASLANKTSRSSSSVHEKSLGVTGGRRVAKRRGSVCEPVICYFIIV